MTQISERIQDMNDGPVYTYKIGLEKMDYDYATAIGLFNSIVSFTMLMVVNFISKRVSETSLF